MALDLFRVSGGFQIDDSTQILEGSAAPALDAPIGSVYTETTTGGLYTKIAAGVGANKWEKQATKTYVDTEITNISNAITALGNAFNYIGVLTGGTSGSGFDLATLPTGGKDAGDYYKVTTAGYFKVGAGAEFYANVGDGLVWNTLGGVDKIDNTDSQVAGTTDEITVSGSADTGYTVAIATTFKNRLSNSEGAISTLQGDVSDLQTTDIAINGAITTLQSNLASEVTARSSADTTLQNNINAEATARAAADVTLQANIDAEATARSLADTTLQAAINTEATARTAADVTLQNNINAEATLRANADTTLQANIAAEATLRANADTTLQANIAAEATARSNEDGFIRAFVGKSGAGSELPTYSSTTQVTQSGTLETAIGELDAAVGGDVTTNTVVTSTNSVNTNIQSIANYVEASGKVVTVAGDTSLTDTVPADMAKWIVYIQDEATPAQVTAYEVFAASNGSSVDFNRFGILKLSGGVVGAAVTVAQAGANMTLTASATGNANITIKRVSVV